MSSLPITSSHCSHSAHLFLDPLCPKQSLLKRVANVAFHILTLAIPLIYHRICAYYAQAGLQPFQKSADIKPYSPLGQAALDFARKQLGEHPHIVATQFKGNCFSARGWFGLKSTEPANPEIARLTTLYWDVTRKAFEQALKNNEEAPWSQQEVLDAADACMKVSYAISNLTLDDLDPFTRRLTSKGDQRTYAEALTKQDSYQYRTFYYCSENYHELRGQKFFGLWPYEEYRQAIPNKGFYFPAERQKDHEDLFYQQETIQNSWNQLYNEYCRRVRQYVPEKELGTADNRHVTWTQEDTPDTRASFRDTPDSLPT